MKKHTEDSQNFKLETISDKCPECIDERLVRLAYIVGALVCPNCDLILVKSYLDNVATGD